MYVSSCCVHNYHSLNHMLTKRIVKKLDGNWTRMLRAKLNKSWKQHHTIQQLYGHLRPISKTIQIRQTRHPGHCCRSKDELQWTPSHGRASVGQPTRTYLQQLCMDTGCSLEDLLEVMDDKRQMARENQENQYLPHDMMMMMMILYSLYCIFYTCLEL